MSKETITELISTVEKSAYKDGLNADAAVSIWKKTSAIYRLRLQNPYLIQIESAMTYITKILEETYPTLGTNLQKTFMHISSDSEALKTLIKDVFTETGTDYTIPASAEEENIINSLLSFNDFKSITEDVKEKVLEYLLK